MKARYSSLDELKAMGVFAGLWTLSMAIMLLSLV